MYYSEAATPKSRPATAETPRDIAINALNFRELICKFSEMHKTRMRRDFGVEEPCDTKNDPGSSELRFMGHNTPTGNKHDETFTHLSERMWNAFGNDVRSGDIFDALRKIVETDNKIARELQQLLRVCSESHAQAKASFSKECLGLLNDYLTLLRRISNQDEIDPKGAIMSMIKRMNFSMGSSERLIESLKEESLRLDQALEEMTCSKECHSKYSCLLDKEAEMRTYIDLDYPAEKAKLENVLVELEQSKLVLGAEVTKLQKMHEEFPNLTLMTVAMTASTATLSQLEKELVDRRAELAKLFTVENTLVEELDSLRKRKLALSDTLNQTKEDVIDMIKRDTDRLADEVNCIVQSNEEMQRKVSHAKNDLNSLREKICQGFGSHMFERMQTDSRILFAKQKLTLQETSTVTRKAKTNSSH